MKITRSKLKQLALEELQNVLKEGPGGKPWKHSSTMRHAHGGSQRRPWQQGRGSELPEPALEEMSNEDLLAFYIDHLDEPFGDRAKKQLLRIMGKESMSEPVEPEEDQEDRWAQIEKGVAP